MVEYVINIQLGIVVYSIVPSIWEMEARGFDEFEIAQANKLMYLTVCVLVHTLIPASLDYRVSSRLYNKRLKKKSNRIFQAR